MGGCDDDSPRMTDPPMIEVVLTADPATVSQRNNYNHDTCSTFPRMLG